MDIYFELLFLIFFRKAQDVQNKCEQMFGIAVLSGFFLTCYLSESESPLEAEAFYQGEVLEL